MARSSSPEVSPYLNVIGPNQRILVAVVIGALVTWLLRTVLPFPYPIALGWIGGVTVFLASTQLYCRARRPTACAPARAARIRCGRCCSPS